MRASAIAVVLLGCGGAKPNAVEPTLAGKGERPAPVSLPAATPSSASAVAGAHGIRLEPEVSFPTPAGRVRIEFLAPVFGETLPELGLRRQEVRLLIAPLPLAAGSVVMVSFDGLRPRAVGEGGTLSVGELVPEDQPIGDGVHSLLAVVVDAEGRVASDAPVPTPSPPSPSPPSPSPAAGGSSGGKPLFAITDFFVGQRAGSLPRPDTSRLFCLSPGGTYHGRAGDRPILQLLAVGRFPPAVPLRLETSSGVFEAFIDPKRPYRVFGLPAGDVRVRAGSASGPHAECVATLNPERSEGS
jgi:hypothetical protein